MKKQKKVSIHLRLTPTLKAELKKFCIKKGVTMTDYIEALLSKSLKRN